MVDQIINIFKPLTDAAKVWFERKDKNKDEVAKMKRALVDAMQETRKAISLIKIGTKVEISEQYRIADLWKEAFLIISDSHPKTAYALMGKSNLWLTPEFWNSNKNAFDQIEKWFITVEQIIFPNLNEKSN
jgi:hypothetical protein